MAESKRICAVADCNKSVCKRDWCDQHYKRWWKHGDPLAVAPRRQRPTCQVDGCDNVSTGLGFCNGHYKRFVKWGDPLAGGMTPGTQQAWLKDNANHQGDDCLTWPFARDRNGYGKVRFREVGTSAHRAMCFTAHGEPEDLAMHAAHTCHNGHLGCVNPKHLIWQDGFTNRSRKLRQRRGVTNRGAVLGPIDVIGARLMMKYQTQAVVAAEFGVARTTMGQIKRGEIWKHL